MDMHTFQLAAHDLVLRQWTSDDLDVMQELFDDPDVAYRTPLESPFDQAAALRYLHNVHQARRGNERIHLASPPTGNGPWEKSCSTRSPAASATSWAPPTGDSGWQCALSRP
ncbi:GNAT family N-acetyltransferase [Streptomyces sp. NPDC050546]|uniref:GNAT family N-acetyltransferase n=1 Tax=Streptomyces sp. NPDC050546 TaxID=3365628 RepID=UPI0037AC3C9F